MVDLKDSNDNMIRFPTSVELAARNRGVRQATREFFRSAHAVGAGLLTIFFHFVYYFLKELVFGIEKETLYEGRALKANLRNERILRILTGVATFVVAVLLAAFFWFALITPAY